MSKHQIEISIECWKDGDEYPYFLNITADNQPIEVGDTSFETKEDAIDEAEIIINEYFEVIGRKNLQVIRNY